METGKHPASFVEELMSFPASEADVLAIAAQWLARGHGVALATVVRTSGSAPRQDGSHIVVRDDGAFEGSVSAGCAENAVIELAQAALRDRQNRTACFGVSDGVLAPGLLCGGEIEILVEPII
jgi:xanthine dehydrogenase accessory factor